MRSRRQESSLVVDAPAKLNLFLAVRGRRSDGYHDLETVMVSIGLFDTLRFTPAPDGVLQLSSRSLLPSAQHLPDSEANLVLRAARLLMETTQPRAGATIELTKRIPIASGLAGGSTDAAATLHGLNTLWRTGLSREDLHQLAASLGSDVNFFLDSSPLAVCTGRGEIINPQPLRGPLDFVVVRPETGLSTAQVFAALDPKQSAQRPQSDDLLHALKHGRLNHVASCMHNDLQRVAVGLNPSVARALAALSRGRTFGRMMTGSGSACYGLCVSRRHARSLESQLKAEFGGRAWAVRTTV